MAKPTDADKLNAVLLASARKPTVATHLDKLRDELQLDTTDQSVLDYIACCQRYVEIPHTNKSSVHRIQRR